MKKFNAQSVFFSLALSLSLYWYDRKMNDMISKLVITFKVFTMQKRETEEQRQTNWHEHLSVVNVPFHNPIDVYSLHICVTTVYCIFLNLFLERTNLWLLFSIIYKIHLYSMIVNHLPIKSHAKCYMSSIHPKQLDLL